MRRLAALLVLILSFGVLIAAPPAEAVAGDPEHRAITFPVEGPVRYGDDFGDCRGAGCSRAHAGNDLMGTKMQKLLAAADGTVSWTRLDGSGNGGNMIVIEDAAGWEYWYIHINNDTPGTDDGLGTLAQSLAPGIAKGAKVKAGQHVAFLGDSGNAEGTAPHLHFEIHRPDGTAINPYASLRLAQGFRVGPRCGFDKNPVPAPKSASGAGYWALGRDGGIFTFGTAKFFGSMGDKKLNKPVVGMTGTRTGQGYWQVASDGGIFAFGDAKFLGSMGGKPLNKPIVAMMATKTGQGYWMIASDGGIFAFGDAAFEGSAGGRTLTSPIVAMTPTPTGDGYWLLAEDGGIIPFGDATLLGSLPELKVDKKVAGMASTPTGLGYWIVTTDGNVYSFGDAAFHGAPALSGLCQVPAAVRIVSSTSGKGYWVQSADGTTWAFGDARHYGDVTKLGLKLNTPMIDLAILPAPTA
jgi:hypothetical protein